jgi:hypothetical protein
MTAQGSASSTVCAPSANDMEEIEIMIMGQI